jgi:upstream activation factor subunit UAF30
MAKKTTKKAAAPKKATAKKAAAPKKATAKKAAAPKKATAKKAAAPKKATAKKVAAPKKATAKKVAAPKKKSARKPNAAFMKALTPSAVLAEVIGSAAVPRTEVVKKIWAYIKKHNLQNPKNKRNILADEKLAKVFGKKEVTMFEMTKLVSNHLK